MKILITGAFGLVGKSVIKECLFRKYSITLFDRPSARNKQAAKKLKQDARILWGDVTHAEDVSIAVQGQDIVIHLAALIPPVADRLPDLANAVNVEGTRNVLEAIKNDGNRAKLLYSSSIAIYGDRVNNPNITVSDEPHPNNDDYYGQQKLLCEGLIRSSGIRWTILRLTYIVSENKIAMDPLMFRMPLATSLEVCDTRDTALAFVNAAERDDLDGMTLNIAGGPRCRTTYGEYLKRMLALFGFGRKILPEKAFAKKGYHCGFMDSEKSEKLLHFQKNSLDEYYGRVGKQVKNLRFFVPLFKDLILRMLLKQSPYFALK
jgi:nucleoside-diphosphate-sugar epimerase